MNNKSIDEKYNKLIKDLRDKMDILAKKIEPKIMSMVFEGIILYHIFYSIYFVYLRYLKKEL